MLQKFIYLFIFLGAFDDTWSDSLDETEIKTAKLQLLKVVNWKVIRKWTKKSLLLALENTKLFQNVETTAGHSSFNI